MNWKLLSAARQAELIEAEQERLWADTDDCWSEAVTEDWQEKLAALGFEHAEIAWSGFSSQGDGASFTADLGDKTAGLPADLQQEIDDARQVEFVTRRLDGDDRIRTMDDLDFNVEIYGKIERNDHHYVHHRTIGCTLTYNGGRDIPETLQGKLDTWANEREKEVTETAQELSRQIYRDLEKEWDYLTSKKAIAERLAEDCDDYEMEAA